MVVERIAENAVSQPNGEVITKPHTSEVIIWRNPKETEIPQTDVLYEQILEARVSRQLLLLRKSLPSWAKADEATKIQVEEALEQSAQLRGYVKLPDTKPKGAGVLKSTLESVEKGITAYSQLKSILRANSEQKLE